MKQRNRGAIEPTKKSKRSTVMYMLLCMILVFLVNCNETARKKEGASVDSPAKPQVDSINYLSLDCMQFDTVKIKAALRSQIEGDRYTYGGPASLEALFNMASALLANNGFEPLEMPAMRERLKEVFGFIPSGKDSVLFLTANNEPVTAEDGKIIDPFKNIMYVEIGSRALRIYDLYVSEKYQLIIPAFFLPQLIDYHEMFPESLAWEKEPVYDRYFSEFDQEEIVELATRWKDEDMSKQWEKNQAFIVHLNRYVMHANDASLTWLMDNCPFLELLVEDFGYTKDKRLLKWVIDKNLNKGCEWLGNVFARRNMHDQLSFNQDALEIIRENISKTYMSALSDFMVKVRDKPDCKIVACTYGYPKFSEYAEVYARILHFAETIIRTDYHYGSYKYNFMVGFVVDWPNADQYEAEFKKNDYYKLPHFKEYWEEAKQIKKDEYDHPKGPERSPFKEEDQG